MRGKPRNDVMHPVGWRLVSVVLLAAQFLAAWALMIARPAAAQEERRISILIAPSGSGPYEAFAVMQTRAKENHPWLRPVAVDTPGANYNVKYLAENPNLWQNSVIASGSVLEWARSPD